MDTTKTFLGLTLIYPRLFKDNRGAFFESFNLQEYEKVLPYKFVQSNISYSKQGTLRGIHFQEGESSQGKLITVIEGSIYDIAVDLNFYSPTKGDWESNILNKGQQIFVPPGFGHGFYALENSIIEYKVTNYYNKESERTIIYSDPDLNIPWPIKDKRNLIISYKDLRGVRFRDL